MSKVIEDMKEEVVLRERREIAHTFIMMGEISYEEIAEGTKPPIEEIKKMAEKEREA